MKLDYHLVQYTRVESKWIKDLETRPRALKFIEENISEILQDCHTKDVFGDNALGLGNENKSK